MPEEIFKKFVHNFTRLNYFFSVRYVYVIRAFDFQPNLLLTFIMQIEAFISYLIFDSSLFSIFKPKFPFSSVDLSKNV